MSIKNLFCSFFFLTTLLLSSWAQQTKAPMYYSLYAYLYTINNNSTTQYAMPENMWKEHIDYVSTHLAPLGFDRIVTDGWGETIKNEKGFRTKHHSSWVNDFSYWGNYCSNKGIHLGLYENPLWMDDHNTSMYSSFPALWFNWLDINHNDAETYIKEYIAYYASFGVDYLRVDFLSWYEDGRDKNTDFEVRHDRPVADYIKALSLLNKYADMYGIQLSLVMPHLKEEAINERLYAPGSSIRVNEDQCEGTWNRLSDLAKGKMHIDSRTNEYMWSLFHNTFDGMIYWSRYAGFNDTKHQLILDGDFIWLSSFANEEEKKTALTINLVAGGSIALTEYHISDIQQSIHLLQNSEVFALNKEGFVGKPLSHDPVNQTEENQAKTQIWRGKMPNSTDYIVAFFNRENTTTTRSISFSDLPDNIHTQFTVRDLWDKTNIGTKENLLTASIPAHGCKLYRLTPVACSLANQTIDLQPITDKDLAIWSNMTMPIQATTNTSLPLSYTVTGPATLNGNSLTLGKTSGEVHVAVTQKGDNTHCPAIATTTFTLTNGCAPIHQLYVTGNFSNTSTSNWVPINGPMTREGSLWKRLIYIESAGNTSLVFTNTSQWTKKWGGATGLTGTCIETTSLPDGNDIHFNAPKVGHYMITFDECDWSYSITPIASQNTAMYIGSDKINNWALGNTPMTLIKDNTWQTTVDLAADTYVLKFANTSNWTGKDWGNATGLDGIAIESTGGAPNISFTIAQPNTYLITFNESTLVYSITPAITTSITNAHAPNINVYKEKDNLYIHLGDETRGQASIYTMAGQLIQHNVLSANNTLFSTTSLQAKGLYLIKVQTATRTQSFKIWMD